MALQHEHTAKRRAERENAAASDAESALISASVEETHKEET
jgi:hypothetical protein